MALTKKNWSPEEILISERFNQLRKQAGNPTLQEIADQAGLTRSRLRDILLCQHGAPMLSEILALCDAFGVNPAKEIDAIQKGQKSTQTPSRPHVVYVRDRRDEKDIKKISSLLNKAQTIAQQNLNKGKEEGTTHPQPAKAATNNPPTSVPSQSQIEDMIKNFQLVANTDPNKKIESETPDD